MNSSIRRLVPALVLVTSFSVLGAAEENKPVPKESKGAMRIISGPGHEARVLVRHDGDKREPEMENVAFLGVETSPVSATLTSQLGLAAGSGLVVNHVLPKSPADGVLQEHDILLKLDDQILIESRQLAVLIRSHKEGDEVTLSYLRGGQKASAKVKLAQHNVPKFSINDGPTPRAFAYSFGGDRPFEMPRRPDGMDSEEWNRVLSLLERTHGAPDAPPGAVPPAARMRIDHSPGPGFRAMSINTGNSNLVYSDDEGSLDLTMKDGVKNLVAKNAKGEPVFSGRVTTPEERKAMPPEVRARLEKLEDMHDVSFRTDGDFKGGEMKVIRPRGISLPLQPAPMHPERHPSQFL